MISVFLNLCSIFSERLLSTNNFLNLEWVFNLTRNKRLVNPLPCARGGCSQHDARNHKDLQHHFHNPNVHKTSNQRLRTETICTSVCVSTGCTNPPQDGKIVQVPRKIKVIPETCHHTNDYRTTRTNHWYWIYSFHPIQKHTVLVRTQP